MLSQEKLKENLHYNKNTGQFKWRVTRGSQAKKGNIAGSNHHNGYKAICILGKRYYIHRLAWLYIKGYFPENNIDHIDQNKSNNKITNLRETSNQCNARNSGNPSTNTSGVKGVTWFKRHKKWQAKITVKQKQIHLGFHISFLEAVAHRLAAEQAEDWAGCDSHSPAYQYMQLYLNPANLQDKRFQK